MIEKNKKKDMNKIKRVMKNVYTLSKKPGYVPFKFMVP